MASALQLEHTERETLPAVRQLADAAAGAIRLGNTVGAAMNDRRVLEPVEAHIMTTFGLALFGLAALFAFFPRLLAYPLITVFIWLALALLYRGYRLRRRERKRGAEMRPTAQVASSTEASRISPNKER